MFESRDPAILHPPEYPRLLGDIGATNVRFGWQASVDAAISHVQVSPCAEHVSLLAAARTYLRQQGLPVPPCAAFGIASPVTGDQVTMTNYHWKFSVAALRQGLGVAWLLLLNDFTALALSLTTLAPECKRVVGSGVSTPGAAIGLVGPGTGLGVSGLLPACQMGQWIPITGEGGHVSLAAANALEFAVIQNLQKRHGHVSAERVLSGTGLVDLHRALCEIKSGVGHDITTPAQIMERAREYPDSIANEAMMMFCGFLGSVAGDLALTLGARGGVYIGGGIVPHMGERFAGSPFRSRFEEKGRYKTYLQPIPTWVIHSPVSPALQGASNAMSLGLGDYAKG